MKRVLVGMQQNTSKHISSLDYVAILNNLNRASVIIVSVYSCITVYWPVQRHRVEEGLGRQQRHVVPAHAKPQTQAH